MHSFIFTIRHNSLLKSLAMIDTESCSSYDWGTLVEISAGFDGSEGGVNDTRWNKNYKFEVFMNAKLVYRHKKPK